MTIPIERTWAVINTREFLVSLLDPARTPRVPGHVRTNARQLLKHYPNDLDMRHAMVAAPWIWGENEKG